MVQLGILSIIPYFAELVLEHGPIRAATDILHQVSGIAGLRGQYGCVYKQYINMHTDNI